MFSQQGFQEQSVDGKSKSILKRTQSPRIGILGSATFSTNGNPNRKLEDQPSNTVNRTIKRIEEQMVLGYELLSLFKQEANVLRNDVDVLMQDLVEKVEEVPVDVKPEFYKDYKMLKGHIKSQKEESDQLFTELDKVSLET